MSDLTVKQDQFSFAAAELLRPACDDLYPLSALEVDVLAGRCTLCNVYQHGIHIASFVLRIDDDELVVVVAGGKLPGGSLYKQLTPYVEHVARLNGCRYLRGHTKRRAVGRLMENAGWEQSEIVYRKEVSNGQ